MVQHGKKKDKRTHKHNWLQVEYQTIRPEDFHSVVYADIKTRYVCKICGIRVVRDEKLG